MTAICKTIAVHGDRLSYLLDYGSDQNKTFLEQDVQLNNLFEYAKNESKTAFINPVNDEKSLLVTGYNCSPETADAEFKNVRDMYPQTQRGVGNKQKPVTAIHLIQSFKETNISPVIAHKIGLDMLEKLGYMGVVDTHMNKTHVHNHIIINAYHMNGLSKINLSKKFIMDIRNLSDKTQQEYGIPLDFDAPRKQLEHSKDCRDYGQWRAMRAHTSWKVDMYQTMLLLSETATSREDYINLMNRFGYNLAEKKANGDLVWFSFDGSKKIKESTLYKEFQDNEFITSDSNLYHFDYLETGYTWDGKQLTNIENKLRDTYNTISLIANFVSSKHFNFKNKTLYYEKRLQDIKWARRCKELYDVSSMSDINKRLNEIGSSLSVTKRRIKDIESISNYYDQIKDISLSVELAKNKVSNLVDIGTISMCLPKYNLIQINENSAKLAPLNAAQKRDLYCLMKKHPEYRLTYCDRNYSNISIVDYYNICNFFRYQGDLPKCLCLASEFNSDIAYQRQYSFISKRLDYSATKQQISNSLKLLKEKGFDTSILANYQFTLADIINIENCCSPSPNFILKNDSGEAPSKHDLENCIAACKNILYKPSIPFNSLTKLQCRNLYIWACSQGKTPCCYDKIRPIKSYDKEFKVIISDYPTDIQKALLEYRDAVEELNLIGLDYNHTDKYVEQSKVIEKDLVTLNQSRDALSKKYKDLLHLKQTLAFTNDDNYIYGFPLIRDEFIKDVNKSKEKYIDQSISQKNAHKVPKHNFDIDL